MAQEQTVAQEITRKITIGTLTGGPKKWFDDLIKLPEGARRMKLCAIYGYAAGYKAGATDFGEFIKFQGQFEGVNMSTGEVVRAPQVILPTFLAGSLQAGLDMEGAKTVQFAVEVHVEYDSSAAQKFVYKLIDRLPVQENDPLSALRLNVAKAIGYAAEETKQLQAPATQETPPAADKGKSRHR